MSDALDPGLRRFCDALAERVDGEIVRAVAVPDAADVLVRARAIDAQAVPSAWSAAIEDEIVPLAERRALAREHDDAAVAAFAGALRGAIERDLQERGMAEIPAPPRRTRPRVALGVGLAVLAAGLVAALVALTPRWMEREGTGDASSAMQTLQRGEATDAWQASDGVPPAERTTPRRSEPSPPEPPPQASSETTSATTTEPEPPGAAKPRPPSLDELAEQAEVAWRAGDLDGAEQRLRRIIARGGRSQRAELAWGDLFALARQRDGASGPVPHWRAYLRQFPRGRYAEDARAGLCRRAEGEADTRACWSEYLRAHPAGSHAREARRWTDVPPAP
ncbi:MAG: hypothetical protein U0168_10360 [Nannocystaceae bacterium]|jgi:hypothetical protein